VGVRGKKLGLFQNLRRVREKGCPIVRGGEGKGTLARGEGKSGHEGKAVPYKRPIRLFHRCKGTQKSGQACWGDRGTKSAFVMCQKKELMLYKTEAGGHRQGKRERRTPKRDGGCSNLLGHETPEPVFQGKEREKKNVARGEKFGGREKGHGPSTPFLPRERKGGERGEGTPFF